MTQSTLAQSLASHTASECWIFGFASNRERKSTLSIRLSVIAHRWFFCAGTLPPTRERGQILAILDLVPFMSRPNRADLPPRSESVASYRKVAKPSLHLQTSPIRSSSYDHELATHSNHVQYVSPMLGSQLAVSHRQVFTRTPAAHRLAPFLPGP